MPKYMVCVCGWVSEEYPDTWMPVGLGGVLDCPICHAQQRNATLEMCYGHVSIITLNELRKIRKWEAMGIPWESALSLNFEMKIWEQASIEDLAKTYEKLENKSIHCHLAWFGSELACQECNPVCYKNHQMDNPNHLQWCGEEKCPLNPKRFGKKTYPVKYNQELLDYLNSPREGPIKCPRCDSTNIGMDSDDNHLCNECGYHFDDDELWEEKEDNIRKSNRKSIRKGGKYKERGKEKRREP